MKKQKKKFHVRKSRVFRDFVNPDDTISQLRSTKMLKDCLAIVEKKKATRNAIKKRLLRRWKGTALEVKTTSEMWFHPAPLTVSEALARCMSLAHGPVRFGVSTVGPISTSY